MPSTIVSVELLKVCQFCNNSQAECREVRTLYSNVCAEIHVVSIYASSTQGIVLVVGVMYKTGRIWTCYTSVFHLQGVVESSSLRLRKAGRLSRSNDVEAEYVYTPSHNMVSGLHLGKRQGGFIDALIEQIITKHLVWQALSLVQSDVVLWEESH